jgi:replicative DNA helicase
METGEARSDKGPPPPPSGLVVLGEADSGDDSTRAECALLGTLLADGDGVLVKRCRDGGLAEKAFADGGRRMIWGSMERLVEAGAAVTIETVAQDLHGRGELEDAGGMLGLFDLGKTVQTTAQWKYFLDKVLGYWRSRQVQWVAMQLKQAATQHAGNWDEAWKEMAPSIDRLRTLQGGDVGQDYEAIKTGARQRLERLISGSVDKSRWLYSGLDGVDTHLGPVDYSNEDMLIIVAGQPGGGKSALARQYASEALKRGGKVGAFLLETTAKMWALLMASQRARVNLRMLEGAPRDIQERLAEGYVSVEKHLGRELFLYDDTFKLSRIVASALELNRAVGGLSMLIVDYAQLVEVDVRKCRQREEEVAYIARSMKLLAKEVGCPVFALCQLNREAQRENRRPRKGDLRESGALEQAADRILALHVPQKDIRGADQTDNQARVQVDVCQLKMRNGPIGDRMVWFDRPYTVFSDMGDQAAAWKSAPVDGKKGEMRPGMRKDQF